VSRLDEHGSGNLIPVPRCEYPNDPSTSGVPDENDRHFCGSVLQQLMKIFGHL
jgi:hypothetical protein